MTTSFFKKTPTLPINIQEIAETIKLFTNRNFPEARLVILFGSRAYGKQEGDVDFKIFVDDPNTTERRIVAKFAKDLNKKYAPRCSQSIQKDVPYEVKSILSYSLIEQALQLVPFMTHKGDFVIDPIRFSQDFLSSEECQMRVILSCFTTPNLCLYGSPEIFNMLCDKAFTAVLNLVCSTWSLPSNDFEKILPFFLFHPDGSEYKSYLGYRNTPQVISYLRNRFNHRMRTP